MKSRFAKSGFVIAIVGALAFGRAWAADASEDAEATRELGTSTATSDADQRAPSQSEQLGSDPARGGMGLSAAGSGGGGDAAVERGDSQPSTLRHRSTVERGAGPTEQEAEERERQQQIWTAP